MELNNSILNNIIAYIEEKYDIRLDSPKCDNNDIKATLDGVDVVISVTFTVDEMTGECVNIELYTDDVPELDDETLDRDDTDCADVYSELNEEMGRGSDFAHYMNNEEDDDEDRGQSM